MGLIKGIIHVHSKFSYDGQHSLEEIASHGKSRGYGFIGMSEHSDTLTEEMMLDYVSACKNASSPGLLVIPGIEFTCENNLHLIGLGVQHCTDLKDPIKVAEFIRQQGKVSIIAHPVRYKHQIPPGLEQVVNGIEVWNARYDSRFVPNDRSLRLWNKLRHSNASILAFGGQDFHRIANYWYVEVSLSCEKLGEECILSALRNGDFTISNPYFRLNPKGGYTWAKSMQMRTTRMIYRFIRGIRNGVIRKSE